MAFYVIFQHVDFPRLNLPLQCEEIAMVENLTRKEQIRQWYGEIGCRPGDLDVEEDPNSQGHRYWVSKGRKRVTITLPSGHISEPHEREIKQVLSILKLSEPINLPRY